MLGTIETPSQADSDLAQRALRQLAPVTNELLGAKMEMVLHADDAPLELVVPGQILRVLLSVLAQIASGNAVTVLPVHAELTTQQAADLLNVSRPFLVALLDGGKIPFRKVGTRRRVRAADVFVYQRQDEKRRQDALDALAAQAQDLKLGY